MGRQLNVFHHIYSKDYEGKRRRIKKVMKIRGEVQEYPNKPLNDALMNKLIVDVSDDKTFTVDMSNNCKSICILVDTLLKS